MVSSIAPGSGPAGGGTGVTVTGSNFAVGATLRIGGVPAVSVSLVNSTRMTASTPPLSPGTLNDVTATNPGGASGTLARGWFADFLDVPQSNGFHDDVEVVFRSGVTSGCGFGNYCVAANVTRAQMAVLLLKARHGSAYVPPPATGIFADVPPGSFARDWIEELFNEGITAGCGGGNFCPSGLVTRGQVAPMLLKAEHGSAYVPPPSTGIFADVPPGAFARDWIEQLFHEGITAGCGGGNYCPGLATPRGQMATFLVKTFDLLPAVPSGSRAVGPRVRRP